MTVTWGVNRWVLAELDGASVQRQVDTPAELARLLADVGVPTADAERTAERLWRERPADARLATARGSESPWRSTGLPWWGALAILLAFVLLYAGWRLL